MSDLTCNLCNKKFSRLFTLKRHTKVRPKSCIKIENKLKGVILRDKDKEKEIKSITQKYENLLKEKDKEIKYITQKYEIKLEDKDRQLEKYHDQCIAKNTTVNTINQNIIIQNLEPLVKSKMVEYSGKLTDNYLFKGPKGIAKYAMDFPLKNRIFCSDVSRCTLKYKTQDGVLVTDTGGRTIVTNLIDSLDSRCKEIRLSTNGYSSYNFKLLESCQPLYTRDPEFIVPMTKEICILAKENQNNV